MSKELELYVAQKELFDKEYDLNVSTTPKMVTLKKVKFNPANGEYEDVQVKNMAMKKKEVDDFINGSFVSKMNQSYNVTNADFLEKIEQMPNGGHLTLVLQEDVVWNRSIIKKNVNIHINLNNFKLILTEYVNNNNNQSVIQRLDSVDSTLSFDGGNNLGSKIVLPQKIELYYHYIDTISFANDIRLILKTLKII